MESVYRHLLTNHLLIKLAWLQYHHTYGKCILCKFIVFMASHTLYITCVDYVNYDIIAKKPVIAYQHGSFDPPKDLDRFMTCHVNADGYCVVT